jgi:hypothetical protein
MTESVAGTSGRRLREAGAATEASAIMEKNSPETIVGPRCTPAARRRGLRSAWLAALLLLVPAAPVLAWGPVGHRAVGAVADSLLTPQARAQVSALLADDRDRDDRPSGRQTLAEVASWADEIRGGPLDHPHWHYDDRPVCADTGKPWCVQADCNSAEIVAQLAVLGDRSRPLRARNEALKWIVHLVGDLHQPLHAADFAHGGNQIPVAPHGSQRHGESLHIFWDFQLVTLALHVRDGEVPRRVRQRLEQRARAEDPALVAQGPEQWARESNALARAVALDLPGIGCDIGPPGGPYPTVTLGPRYLERAEPVVLERLALAGARLAYVLNATLGSGQ